MGQLQNPSSTLTVGTLIQDASVTSTGEFEQILRSSVIEPTLVEDINEQSSITNPLFRGAENEIVSYIVYQSPSQSITTGTNMPYSLIMHMDGNFVYYPKASDTFAFSLTPPERKGTGVFHPPETSRVSSYFGSLANSTISSPSLYTSVWGKVKSAVGTGLDLVDSYYGGFGKRLDNSLLGGRIQKSLGLTPIEPDWLQHLDSELLSLKNGLVQHDRSSARSHMYSNSNIVDLREKPEPLNSLVPKDDYLYYFRQLRTISNSFRGTDSQVAYWSEISQWINKCVEWYETQPDWIDPTQTTKKLREIAATSLNKKRDVSKDPDDSFQGSNQRF